MTTLTIELPEELEAFVTAQVAERGYPSAGEYLLDLVREAQIHQAKLRLEAKLREALDEGPAEVMTPEDWESIEREALEGLARERHRP